MSDAFLLGTFKFYTVKRLPRVGMRSISTLGGSSGKWPNPDISLPSEIHAGSVLAYVTKRIAAITRPRALVVLRFLLNNPPKDGLFLAKLHNPLSYKLLYPFSRDR